ncbi:MAG: hypothetical protein V2A78_13910 [bacterium]
MFLFFLALGMLHLTALKFYGLQVLSEEKKVIPLNKFGFLKSDGTRIHVLKGSFDYHWYSQTTVKIIPDDRLLSMRINGMKLDNGLFSKVSNSGWVDGYDVNVLDYVSLGKNEIILEIEDSGGMQYGAEVENTFRDPTFRFWYALALFSLVLLLIRITVLLFRWPFFERLLSNLHKFAAEEPFILCMLLLGFIIRILYIFIFTTPQDYLVSDMGGYDERACQMVKGQEIFCPTYWPPFFHIFLSWIYRPLQFLGMLQYRVGIYIVFMALLSVMTNWALYGISLKLFSKRVAQIVLLTATFWYPLIYLNIFVLSENLFIPLLYIGLYILVCGKQNVKNAVALGVLWSAAFLTRPIFLSFIPLFLLWALYHRLGRKYILSFFSTVLLIVFLMVSFNISTTKGREKSISSGGGVNFALTWCEAKSIEYHLGGYGYSFVPPAAIDYPENKRIVTNVPFYDQRYYYQMGLNSIKRDPKVLFRNLRSIFRLFHSHMFPRWGNIFRGYQLTQLFKILNIFFLVLSIVAVWRVRRGKLPMERACIKYVSLFVLLFFSLLIAVYLQNPGEERYIIPYAPLFIILGSPILDVMQKGIHDS